MITNEENHFIEIGKDRALVKLYYAFQLLRLVSFGVHKKTLMFFNIHQTMYFELAKEHDSIIRYQ